MKLPAGWTFKYVGTMPPFNGKGYMVFRKGVPMFCIAVDRQIPINRHLDYIWGRELGEFAYD